MRALDLTGITLELMNAGFGLTGNGIGRSANLSILSA